MCVCVCTHIYIYIYTHTDTHIHTYICTHTHMLVIGSLVSMWTMQAFTKSSGTKPGDLTGRIFTNPKVRSNLSNLSCWRMTGFKTRIDSFKKRKRDGNGRIFLCNTFLLESGTKWNGRKIKVFTKNKFVFCFDNIQNDLFSQE